MVESACDAVANQLKAKGLTLRVDLDHIPLMLMGDSVRLGQILRNYLSNAVKFTASGGVEVRSRTQSRSERGVVLRFEVADTGIGISKAQMARLFRDFEQANASTTRRYGGTGLGLSISQKLARLMGGTVGAESEVGKGSTFWVELPFEVSSELPANIENLRGMEGTRALILDDSEGDGELLRTILSMIGIKADAAATADRAMERIISADGANAPYRLLYLKDKMPGLDGIDFARALKSRNLQNPPEIFLVTDDDLPRRSEVENAGVLQAIARPITPSRVHDAIAAWMKGRRCVGTHCPLTERSAALKVRSGSKILLAEDNAVNQAVAYQMLASASMAVTVVEDGQKAVEAAKTGEFDLILMDIQMPVMDGLQAASAIRALPRGANVPILAMTANAFEEDRKKCLLAGMNDHIAKPVEIGDLYARLIRWLPVRRANPDVGGAKDGMRPDSEASGEMSDTDAIRLLRSVGCLDVEFGLSSMLGDVRHFARLLRCFRRLTPETAMRFEGF